MKRALIILLVLLIPSISAQVLEIESIDKGSVVIIEFDEPARFQLNIKNNGQSDNFEIYSLVGITIKPDEKFYIASGDTISLDIEAYPSNNIKSKHKGFVKFQYEIYSPKNGITKDELLIKIIDLRDIVEARIDNIQPGDKTATLYIEAEKIKIDNLTIKTNSNFFDFEQTLSLAPSEKINFTIPINKDKIKDLIAGTYDIDFDISYKSISTQKKVPVKYLEKGGISVAEKSKGFIIRRTTIEKVNEGNVPTTAVISERKNILTRLVTTHSQEPASVNKQGFYVTYTWEKELLPNQSLEVTTVTNYTLPLIIVAIIILILILVKMFLMTPLVLIKKVSHVRTKGGEFALKLTLHAKAHNNVDSISISDYIPHSMKFFEKFGSKPDSIDERTRKIMWNIPRLNAGEQRVFSYVIYSKLRVFGKFELPIARASYTHNNKAKHVSSNKALFMAETLVRED